MKSDVVIIGGGLAGLVNAILLARNGLKVILVEKKEYPFHKVCGEYISNEVLPFLKSLNLNPFEYGAVDIKRFRLTTPSGKKTETKLPLGGFGISRFTLDRMMFEEGERQGVIFLQKTTVFDVQFNHDAFEVEISGKEIIRTQLVIGAFGKRSVMDRSLSRPFFQRKSPFIGIKSHFEWEMPEDLVELHLFGRGYCGVSKVEEGRVNVCYLGLKEDLKKSGSIEKLEAEVVSKNPYLMEVFSKGKKLFDTSLAINEVSFAPKAVVENHILMSGDSAGLVTPLNGNGMAMAIRSASILSEMILRYFNNEIGRQELENVYKKAWKKEFQSRIWLGRQIQKVFYRSNLIENSIPFLNVFPNLFRAIVRNTHGKPFDIYSQD